MVRNGVRRWCGAIALAWLGSVMPMLSTVRAQGANGPASQDQREDDLERLRAQLATAGADGREARERAIERLLASPREASHALLIDRLRTRDDPDGVRLQVLASLQRHLLLLPSAQFGGATGRARERIVLAYLRACAPFWHERRQGAGEDRGDATWQAARGALQRFPARELDQAARALMAEAGADEQIDALRCLADMQQTVFAATIAERLEVADEAVRAAARSSLQLLTCNEEPIRTKAEFAAWLQANGSLRYVDLVERAARRGWRPIERVQEQLARLRVETACEVVRAHVNRSPGIDWNAVSARVVVDDDGVLDACLDVLLQALPTIGDDASPARASFARQLLQRFQSNKELPRKTRLLEAASYVARAEDGDLAKDLIAALVGQLDAGDAEARIAALRGLRRFPSVDTRARVVAHARRCFADMPAAREQLATALATLAARTAPRWYAPSATDADKVEWLALVNAASRSDEAWGVRDAAIALGQTLDQRDHRVPEVFDLLVDLVRNGRLTTKFRVACAIHLQGWRNDEALADAWLRTQFELLRDPVPELRQHAAESLVTLTESVDSRRTKWIDATIVALRERLAAETEPGVLRMLVECMQSCGREPAMAGQAIGSLRVVLEGLGKPIPPDQQFRVDPLLQALATIGADPRADHGQWLAACPYLVEYKRRQSLRLILANHVAIDLAKDVASAEAIASERARKAMAVIIETGTLKPPRDAWTSSDELQREARDIRAAFNALDTVDEKDRLDKPVHRLLRLEVEIAAGKPQDAAQRAAAWLAENNGRDAFTEDDRNRMRVVAADAQLACGKPEAARKLLDERTGDPPDDATLRDLQARIAHALAATDTAAAVELLGRVWRRTAPEDAAFRGRLMEWVQLRLRLDASLRADTMSEAAKYADQFDSKECPADLREAWLKLNVPR
jgi:hypothetical protein